MTDTPDIPPPSASRSGDFPRRLAIAGAVGVLIALAAVVGLIAGSRLAVSAPQLPGEGSVDAGFARDMGVHHSQAVEMSVLIRDRTDDAELLSLALDIILTQQQQAGQMYAWLELWGLPQTSTQSPMGWMQDHSDPQAHATASDPMPGMATREELNRLAAASGAEAERLYLDLMVAHHEGGIEMAQYAADNAQNSAVKGLAVSIVNSQSAELNVLNDLLAARGGPLPD
ncbi:MAG TPA: DUF305 domain-containing protein [Beutenbergiaceae bacterium]|uniref:DUF305 domain-containing protein n=1 Tax=unclassified Georgenia TaxID=2626815 RepID=UPI002C870BD4|nr:DUF305 domain-containing protein [Georgenia sp. H159]HLS13529.1 DUF305 domain-containing protein [Beutenbergiaceae bacterium]